MLNSEIAAMFLSRRTNTSCSLEIGCKILASTVNVGRRFKDRLGCSGRSLVVGQTPG
jgi:hypothetical protein